MSTPEEASKGTLNKTNLTQVVLMSLIVCFILAGILTHWK